MGSSDENQDGMFDAVLDQMWSRFLPQIRERAEVLESAARAAIAGTLSEEERKAAQSAAHKLAGTLGTFGLDRGTDLAREMELAYSSAVDSESAVGLGAVAAEIRSIIESRK